MDHQKVWSNGEMTTQQGSTFRERLWPAPWLFFATALVIPASFLVFLPISVPAGIATAIGLYLGCLILLFVASPVIEVTDGELHAGRARLPLSVVATAEGFNGADATMQRGQKLDARAWLLIRGWVSPVAKVSLDDANDPTPYWLLSTRRPAELVAALTKR